MSQNEEEEEATPRGRPNSFFAEQAARDRTGMGGNYRGVPTVKSGQQRVSAEDTIGDYDTCWCGLPADHDWPGKDSGLKHPKGKQMSAATDGTDTKPSITRRDLTGFGQEYQDIILKAVNDYGVRFRMTSRGILLYPPDGTDPRSIPMRTNPRTIKATRIWFVKHVALEGPNEKLSKSAQEAVMEERAVELARHLNGPEHPVPEPPAKVSVPTTEVSERLTESVKAAAAGDLHPRPESSKVQSTETDLSDDEGWVTFTTAKGHEEREHWETKNGLHRCRICKAEGVEFVTENARTMGGHWFTHHGDAREKLWSNPEAQEAKVEGLRVGRMTREVKKALDILAPLVEVELSAREERKHTARVDALTKQIASLEAQLAKVTQERDDHKARLELLREAMKA